MATLYMEQFAEILHHATMAIGRDYFLLPVDGTDPVYRERVYCYELYHQLRTLWPVNCPYQLNGEVDKRAHPYFRGAPAFKPDLLIHRPGIGDNFAVIEIKRAGAATSDIGKDLGTLTTFQATAGYTKGIYLIFGAEAANDSQRVLECARTIPNARSFDLWVHSKATAAAELAGSFDPTSLTFSSRL
jgi:hypothetical protein